MTMKEIRFHGRGGQGAVTAAKMVASAGSEEGMHVASFPMYGFERRGMPVVAFTRLDDMPIHEKTQIYTPDCLMIIDSSLLNLKGVFDGFKPGGILVLNSSKSLEKSPSGNLWKSGVVDATGIALDEIGRDIPNTCLIGAMAAATGWFSLDAVKGCLSEYLGGEMLEKNIRSATRGYQEVEVQTWGS